MSLDSVRDFLSQHAPDIEILLTQASSATVALAAAAHGVAPARIAKTLALRVGDRVLLLVTRGDARLDNRKMKESFGAKPRLLDPAETEALTGHPVGGVCPFGLLTPLPVVCDLSLRAFETVLPAAGSINSAVRIEPERLARIVEATWVDVCQAA